MTAGESVDSPANRSVTSVTCVEPIAEGPFDAFAERSAEYTDLRPLASARRTVRRLLMLVSREAICTITDPFRPPHLPPLIATVIDITWHTTSALGHICRPNCHSNVLNLHVNV
jgi:hypothetical protein